jgi:dTDP-4-amino-4,6-dideoxygalactose transaminase
MQVKYSYLEEQFRDYKEIIVGIAEVIEKGDYTLGKPVEEFEAKFARLLGSRYAIGVNSGTDALFLSLKAIGVGTGDEVITTSNTFIATVGAIVATGAKPVLVDALEDFTIDPDWIEMAITPKTKAIMPVHYAGHPADMPRIMTIARKHGLQVVEDSCQAISASIDNKYVGTFGISGGFSLHPLKNLNVWGDGGIIVTDSEKLRDRLVLLRNHGLKNRDEVLIFRYNSRLDSIQAVVGNYLIEHIDKITETRIKWAKRIDTGFSDLKEYITIPERKPNRRYVFHLYMLIVKDRNKLLSHLIKRGIEAKIHYPLPLHLQAAASNLGYKKGDFPVTEALCGSIITLPVHQHLSEDQVDYVIEQVKEFYR